MTGLTALPRAISFSGCGFLGVYHVGVLQCFQKYGKELLDKFTKFGGASAGSLAAVVLAVCPEKLSIGKSLVCGMAAEVRKHPLGLLTPGFHLSAHVKKMMEEVLPEDAHTKATGRVFISVTQDSCKKNHIISEFASRAELIEKHYDGGMTNNLVDFKEETVYVTPFSGGQLYICPPDKIGSFNMNLNNQEFCMNLPNIVRATHAVFPPKEAKLDRYYEQGFKDGLRYLAGLSSKKLLTFTITGQKTTNFNHIAEALQKLEKSEQKRLRRNGRTSFWAKVKNPNEDSSKESNEEAPKK